MQWFRENLQRLPALFTRTLEHLPENDPFYAEFRYKIVNLQKGWAIAHTNAVLNLKQILDGLNPHDYSLFQRAVYVLDLEAETDRQIAAITARLGPAHSTREAIDRHLQLPAGDGTDEQQWTAPKVADQALVIHQALLSPENQEAAAAIEIRRHLIEAIKERFLAAQEAATGRRQVLDREEYFHHEILLYAEELRQAQARRQGRSVRPAPRGFVMRREGSLLNYNTDYVAAETAWLVPAIYDTAVYELMAWVRDHYDLKKELTKLALRINDENLYEWLEGQVADRNARRRAGKPEITAEDLYREKYNRGLASGFYRLGRLAKEHPEDLPGFDDDRWSDLIDEIGVNWSKNQHAAENDDPPIPLDEAYYAKLWQYLGWLLTPPQAGLPGSGAAAAIFRGSREKKEAIKRDLGGKYVTWQDLLHGSYDLGGGVGRVGFTDYRVFQPEKGNVLYKAWTLRDRIAESIMETGAEGLGLNLSARDVKRAMLLGGRRPEWVLPVPVAQTLEAFHAPPRDEVQQVWGRLGSLTKQWILLNPFHWFAYNLRNEGTDLEVVVAGNPYSLAFVRQAMPELVAYMFRREIPSDDLREFIDRGGLMVTLQAANTGWRTAGTLEMLRQLRENQSLTDRTFGRMWRGARITTDFREAILRYASYLSYREQMQADKKAGGPGRPKNFGASYRDEIMALPDVRDRAWALSNELLGAYDMVPQGFVKLRALLPMPFLSWKIVNYKRYWRLAANEFATAGGYQKLLLDWLDGPALNEEPGTGLKGVLQARRLQPGGAAGGSGGGAGSEPPFATGKSEDGDAERGREALRRVLREGRRRHKDPMQRLQWLLKGLGLGVVAAGFVARFFLKALWADLTARAYNWTFHADEERALPPYARFRPHVDWGAGGTGLYGYTDRLSGVGDALGLFGVDDILGYREKVQNGRMTVGQVLLDMAVHSPVQEFVDQIGLPKTVAEFTFGARLFPSVTEPRPIKDRWQYLAEAAQLGDVYRGIERIPRRGGNWAGGWHALGVSLFDPGESQYDEVLSLSRDFAQQHGFGDFGSASTQTGMLAYWLKRSLRMGDTDSAHLFLYRYWLAGGREEGLKDSLKFALPLYRWSDDNRTVFLNSLQPDEQRRLRNAMEFLEQNFTPTLKTSAAERKRLAGLPISDFYEESEARMIEEIDATDFFGGYGEPAHPIAARTREQNLQRQGREAE